MIARQSIASVATRGESGAAINASGKDTPRRPALPVWRRRQAFALAELILAIVVLGVVATPFLLYVTRLPEWQHRLNEQSRQEAGRSFLDQALVVGVDPARTTMARSESNPAVPKLTSPVIAREARAPQSSGVTVIALKMPSDAATTAEVRPAGAGWMLGAGSATPTVTPPLSPLPPRVLAQPIVTPASGHTWTAVELSAGAAAGEPRQGTIQAQGEEGLIVCLELHTPRRAGTGTSRVCQTVDAWELAQGVSGRAWMEYAGSEALGDRVETLADGRRRWTTQQEGQRLIVEPSPSVEFHYQFALATPVLVHGGREIPSGGDVLLDYAGFLDIQSGRVPLRLGWPIAVRELFGARWADAAFGFTCNLGLQPGPSDGNLAGLFTPEAAAAWQDQMPIATQVIGPPALRVEGANWVLLRRKTRLEEPELVQTPAGTPAAYDHGSFGFAAPLLATSGQRFGRLSARHDTLLSSGPELNLTLIP